MWLRVRQKLNSRGPGVVTALLRGLRRGAPRASSAARDAAAAAAARGSGGGRNPSLTRAARHPQRLRSALPPPFIIPSPPELIMPTVAPRLIPPRPSPPPMPSLPPLAHPPTRARRAAPPTAGPALPRGRRPRLRRSRRLRRRRRRRRPFAPGAPSAPRRRKRRSAAPLLPPDATPRAPRPAPRASPRVGRQCSNGQRGLGGTAASAAAARCRGSSLGDGGGGVSGCLVTGVHCHVLLNVFGVFLITQCIYLPDMTSRCATTWRYFYRLKKERERERERERFPTSFFWIIFNLPRTLCMYGRFRPRSRVLGYARLPPRATEDTPTAIGDESGRPPSTPLPALRPSLLRLPVIATGLVSFPPPPRRLPAHAPGRERTQPLRSFPRFCASLYHARARLGSAL